MRRLIVNLAFAAGLLWLAGCAAARPQPPLLTAAAAPTETPGAEPAPRVVPAVHQRAGELPHRDIASVPYLEELSPAGTQMLPPISLAELEASAIAANPTLRRLTQEAAAARARVGYVGALPDPTFGFNVFGHPIETAAGSQRANFSLMQMIPWLARLDAQTQQAAYEALMTDREYAAERLRIIGDIRAAWFRLYVVQKQIETTEANQALLESLIDIANARVATGQATQGDVLLGTLELSNLQEQLIDYRRQIAATAAELNRLAGRDPWTPIAIPAELDASLPDWSPELLRGVAVANQPAIAAAQLQAQATRWGVEVADLRRRPDVSLNANWYVMDDNRPPSAIVDVGEDAWSLGASITLPIWDKKYDALYAEATRRHFAAHASEEEAILRTDALLRELWEQARAAQQTVELYQETILPQARQTIEADQQALANNTVEFDRIIGDFRRLLTLELGYHRALGQLATALARIRQTVGVDLDGRVEMGNN